MPAHRLGGLAAALALTMAACAPRTPAATTPAAATQPTAVATYPAVPAPVAQPADAQVVASAQPLSPLPPAGQMPAGSYMRTIQDRGALVAGVYHDVLLFGFLNPLSNQFEGFDIDLVREIARAIFGDPNRVELRPVAAADRVPLVSSHAVDLVAANMTINAQRKQEVDFSEAYYDAGQRVLTYKTSPYHGIQDLSGKKVCTVEGGLASTTLGKANPYVQVVTVKLYADCLVLLQQGQVSAMVGSDAVLAGLAVQDPALALVGDKLTDEPYGIATAKDSSQMSAFVNAVLRQMKQDGRWKQLYQTWLGRFGATPEPPQGLYL